MSIDLSKLSIQDKKHAEDLCETIAALRVSGKDTTDLQKKLAELLGAENVS